MFGKFFASTFTGSMIGAGPEVFAVWAYVIANTHHSTVELNPVLLAHMIGAEPKAIEDAIAYLCAPDPSSRSKVAEGRRLIREGEFAYHVPNHEHYRSIRNEDERREYNRIKQAESRERRESVKAPVNDKHRMSKMSAQPEPDTEPDVEAPKPLSGPVGEVLERYQTLHPRRKVTEQMGKIVKRALKDFTAPELIEAIEGNAADQWHRERRKHELSYVLRNADIINGFRDRATAPPPKAAQGGARNDDELDRWISRGNNGQ